MLKLHHKITAGCLVCFFLLWSVRIPLVVHAAEASYGAYVYDGSPDSFSGEQQITAQMLYKLTKAEYDQYDFDTILSNIPSSASGFTNYLLYCSNSTLSLAYLPDGVFCVFDDNFSPLNRGSYASYSGLSSISNYGCSLYDYIQDDTSPTSFELYTCNLSSGEWGSVQNLSMYYTNLGTDEHYNYYSAGKKTLIGGTCPVYSVAEAADYDNLISQSNQYMPLIIENMESLTNYNAGSIFVYNGESMIVPEPSVEIEGIENHLFAQNFDVFFCQEKSFINYSVGFSSVGGGYVCIKYDLDDYAKTHLDELTLDLDFRVQLDNSVLLGGYEGPVNSSGYTFVPFNKVFVGVPYWALTHNFLLPCSENTFYQNFVYEKIYSINDAVYNSIVQYKLDPNYDPSRYPDGESSWRNAAILVDNILNNYPAGYYAATEGASGLVDLSRLLTSNLNIAFSDYDVAFFHASGCLRDGNGNASGLFAKKIDFKNGVDSVLANGIGVNENPFDDSFPIIDNGGQVPSSGSFGGIGNIIQNVAFPDRISVLDESYFKVAELYSQDAQTVQDGFWSMMGYFAENPMIETYSNMFDWMPPELLGYIGTCLGICFGFGVFRAIRGRG